MSSPTPNPSNNPQPNQQFDVRPNQMSNTPNPAPMNQPLQPLQPHSPQGVPEPFKGGEVNPDAGQYFAEQARAKANIPTESKTFKITWPAELGATWMTVKNLEQIIKNCCPGTEFKVSE